MEPDNAEALTNRGVALHDSDDTAKRWRIMTCVAVRPDHAAALSNRGVTLHKLRRLEEALASYDARLPRGPIMPRRWPIAASRCMT